MTRVVKRPIIHRVRSRWSRNLKYLSLLAASFLATAWAAPAFLAGLDFPESQVEFGTFVVPNEVNPERAKPILERAPAGAYLSVGTERGFVGAALAPKVDHLVFLDRDPQVVLFDQMNTELLQLAKNREDYVELRIHATPADLMARAKKAHTQSGESFKFLSDEKNIDWWTTYVRGRGFTDFNRPPKDTPLAAFRNANYLLMILFFLA